MRIFLFVLLALINFPAFAQDVAPEWKIISEESRIEFTATQMGAPFDGEFKSFSGKISFDPGNLSASKAAIEIETGSVDARSDDRNKYLPMPDWFNANTFPVARFETTGFERGLDIDQYIAHGNLTIRDKTLPVVLPFLFKMRGDGKASVTGETRINRLDFGVGQGQWKDTETVGADVTVRITLIAEQGASQTARVVAE